MRASLLQRPTIIATPTCRGVLASSWRDSANPRSWRYGQMGRFMRGIRIASPASWVEHRGPLRADERPWAARALVHRRAGDGILPVLLARHGPGARRELKLRPRDAGPVFVVRGLCAAGVGRRLRRPCARRWRQCPRPRQWRSRQRAHRRSVQQSGGRGHAERRARVELRRRKRRPRPDVDRRAERRGALAERRDAHGGHRRAARDGGWLPRERARVRRQSRDHRRRRDREHRLAVRRGRRRRRLRARRARCAGCSRPRPDRDGRSRPHHRPVQHPGRRGRSRDEGDRAAVSAGARVRHSSSTGPTARAPSRTATR